MHDVLSGKDVNGTIHFWNKNPMTGFPRRYQHQRKLHTVPNFSYVEIVLNKSLIIKITFDT